MGEIKAFIQRNLVDFILLGIILFMLAAVLITKSLQFLVIDISTDIGYISIVFLLILFFASMLLLDLKKKLYIRRVIILGTEIFIGILLIGFLPQALAMVTPHDYSATLSMAISSSLISSPSAQSLQLVSIQNTPLSGNFVFGLFSPTLAIVKAYCPNLVSVGTAIVPYGYNSVEITVPGLTNGMTCNFIGYTTASPSQTQEVEGVKI